VRAHVAWRRSTSVAALRNLVSGRVRTCFPIGVWVLCGAVFLGTSGCGIVDPDGLQEELDKNRALWASTRPDDYTMTIERICFCSPQGRGPVRLTVRGLDATAWIYLESGEAVPSDLAPFFPTIDGLFEVIADALQRGASEVRVSYDPATGVPFHLWIDYDEHTADEEVGFAVSLPLTEG